MEDEKPLTKRQRRELRKQEQAAQRTKAVRRKKMITWLVVFIIILVIGGLGYLVVDSSGQDENKVVTDSGDTEQSNNNPFLGEAEALVVITEFSDFNCSACAAAAPVVKQVAEEYGDRVKIVFNSFNLNYRWSRKSLEAGECAFQQGGFWPFHDMIFANQSEWAQADDAEDKFKSYAKTLGLNEEAFNNCLDSGRMSSEVARDTSFARSKDINSTPTFYINNQELVGVRPLEEFKRIIDEELAKAS